MEFFASIFGQRSGSAGKTQSSAAANSVINAPTGETPKWLPWVVGGAAALAMIALLVIVTRQGGAR